MIHLTLDQPAKWTITVLGPDDRPIAGLRLTPHLLRRTDRRASSPTVPDALLEPLTVTTDAKGVATLTYLPGTMVPLSIRVAGPGVAPHTLPLDVPQGKDVCPQAGPRQGEWSESSARHPACRWPTSRWNSGSRGRVLCRAMSGALAVIGGSRPTRSSGSIKQPLKTGPQGAFQTPSTLLSGSTYRVSIRHDGFVPFVSDWVTLNGERAAIPAIRLQPLQKLTGQINDRQGRASPAPGSSCRPVVPRRRPMPKGDLHWPASIPERPSFWSSRRDSGSRAGWSIRRHRPRWGH